MCQYAAFRANARLKLEPEHARDHYLLSIPELAAASGLSESHLRNAAADKGPGRLPTVHEDGHVYVNSQDALRWLEARGRVIEHSFYDSVDDTSPSHAFEDSYESILETLVTHCGNNRPAAEVIESLGLNVEEPACLNFGLNDWTAAAMHLRIEPLWLAGKILGLMVDYIDRIELERRRDIVYRLAETYKERHGGEIREVPIAADGSIFHPGLERRRGYQIGPKGKEIYVSTFEDALARLKIMEPKPYWRRPNVNGIPGIVAGVGWRTIPEKELSRLATESASHA
jgi:hypothetical protein